MTEFKESPVHIDTLENLIEEELSKVNFAVTRNYIKNRYEKERLRTNKKITDTIFAKDIQNQNANLDEFSFGRPYPDGVSSVIMKDYALNHLMSEMSRLNHENNEIYIHDLDHYAVRRPQLFVDTF